MIKKQRGFTIIELIVVIAIIAVLAGIVLVNVTQYINKSKDSAIMGNMRSLQSAASIYFADPAHGNYSGFCGSTSSTAILNALSDISNYSYCGDASFDGNCTTSQWVGAATLYSGSDDVSDNYWCVDSTGYSGSIKGYTGGTGGCSCL